MAGPKYIQTMRSEDVAFTTANTARDGSGTLASAFTGASNSSVVRRVRLAATTVTTLGMIRVFVYDGAGTARMIDEIPVQERAAPGATIASWRTTWTPAGGEILLPSGFILKLSTHNGEAFVATTEGGDY